jgi:hypothetical protein
VGQAVWFRPAISLANIAALKRGTRPGNCPASAESNRRSRRFTALFANLGTLAFAGLLGHTRTGEQIRESVLGANFWFYLGATALPFAVFLLIIGLLYYGVPVPKRFRGPRLTAEAAASITTCSASTT